MSFSLSSVLRPHILSVKPYSSARDEYEGTEGIFLDANENPFGSATGQPYNRYPDPYQAQLKRKIANLKHVRPEQIFLGNGSDEPIDLLIRAACTPGQDEIILLPPTYGMYEVSAGINNVPMVKVSLTPDFQLDVPATLAAIAAHPKAKLIFLCSPNNPTGNSLQREDVIQIIEAFAGLVIVDEAYIDFSSEPSFITLLDRFPNLVVLQTFSKAWGLAALRLGMAFASAELISVLNKIKAPYNVNALTQQLASESLDNLTVKDKMVKEIISQRELLLVQLSTLPLVQKVFPSDANFLLVRVPDGKRVYQYLVDGKIIVRDRSGVRLCEGCLRITVGTPDENSKLIESLSAYRNPNN